MKKRYRYRFVLNRHMLTSQPNRPFCENCNIGLARPNGISKHGFKKWHKYCSNCAKYFYDKRYKHLKAKKSTCDECKFTPQDICQLDIVYIDGDKNNKKNANIKTLCANCNRLFQKNIKKSKKKLLDITVDADVRL